LIVSTRSKEDANDVQVYVPCAQGVLCPAGCSCDGGSADKESCTCPAGSYCEEGSASTNGIPCPEGHYCIGGSQILTACEAPAGNFCPLGNGVAAGNVLRTHICKRARERAFCALLFKPTRNLSNKSDESLVLTQIYLCALTECTVSSGVPCPAGSFCVGQQNKPAPCTCSPGSSCEEGSSSIEGAVVPQGFWAAGMTALKAPCEAAPGNFCPAGGQVATGIPCPVGYW